MKKKITYKPKKLKKSFTKRMINIYIDINNTQQKNFLNLNYFI